MIYILIFFSSFIYSQCDDYSNQSQCDSIMGCDWTENIQTGYCWNHNTAASCPDYPACSWFCDGCWYLGECCGTYVCSGGSYQIDNGYCEEMEMPDCSEMTLSQCNNDSACEWIQNISYGNCGSLTVSQCYDYPGECYVDSNPGWYDNSGSYCTGGTYQIDNSYCQEIEILECSDFSTEFNCNQSDMNCDWIEDVQYGNCADFDNDSNACNTMEGCNLISYQQACTGGAPSDCPEPGCGYSWLEYTCTGYYTVSSCDGYYDIDNSYCEELNYQLGDANQDDIINIQDVIIAINLILNADFNSSIDMNFDQTLNILDVIQLINLILNN